MMNHDDQMKSVVREYFDEVAAIRTGDSSAVARLMALWDPDAVLHVVGPQGEAGWPREYRGSEAIHGRFNDMMNAAKRGVELKPGGAPVGFGVTVVLHSVDVVESKATAHVAITLHTNEKRPRGFEIHSGKFEFEFKSGKLSSVTENVDFNRAIEPRIAGIRQRDLSVSDIGRLTLAAWAIA